MFAGLVVRVATAVSAYPFYNFRYLKLLDEFAKRFEVFCFAGSRLPSEGIHADSSLRVYHVLPFNVPRHVRYRVGPFLSHLWINVAHPDVVWLFDTAGPMLPLLFNRPIVLDLDDPIITLPEEELKKYPKYVLVNELRLVRSKKIIKLVVPTEMIKDKFISLGVDPEKVEVIPNGVDTSLFAPSPCQRSPLCSTTAHSSPTVPGFC